MKIELAHRKMKQLWGESRTSDGFKISEGAWLVTDDIRVARKLKRQYSKAFPDVKFEIRSINFFYDANAKSVGTTGELLMGIFDGMSTFKRVDWGEKFKAYKKCQAEGKYNMVTDAALAAKRIGICTEDYWFIVINYDAFKAKFG